MMEKSKVSLFTLAVLSVVGLVFLMTNWVNAAAPTYTISYWKLDEDPAPAEYLDSVGGNNGAAAVAPQTAPIPAPGLVPIPTPPAVSNTAQLFDGATTGIDVPADPSFDWAYNDSFSIEYWVKVDGGIPTDNLVVVGRDDAATDLHVWTGIWGVGGAGVDGRASFILKDKADNGVSLRGVGAINLADGLWHHVVAVRDDSTDENILYVDGGTLSGVGEETSVGFDYPAGIGFDSAASALNLGWLNLAGDFYFEGTLDEVALYSKALSAAEVEEHYDAGLAGEGIDTLVSDPTSPTRRSGGGGGGGCFINTITE